MLVGDRDVSVGKTSLSVLENMLGRKSRTYRSSLDYRRCRCRPAHTAITPSPV